MAICIHYCRYFDGIVSQFWVSLMAQMVKNLPVMWETWVQSLGWEDPLEKGKTTHSGILVLAIKRLTDQHFTLPNLHITA